MRELSDDEVFGPSVQELSDDDVFGPAEPGFKDRLKTNPTQSAALIGRLTGILDAPDPDRSVMEDYAANQPFDFRSASMASRARDDMAERQAQLGTIGPIQGPEPGVKSVLSGLVSDLVAGGKGARAGVRQMGGDLMDSEYLQEQARKERGQADLMQATNTPNFESDTARGIYGGVSSTLRQAPSIAAAIATRSPGVALGGMVAPIVPDEYGKFRQRGADPGLALLGATGVAGTEYLTERLPMGFLVNSLGRTGAGEFLTGLLAREIPGEQVATLVQDAIDTAIANPDKTWGEYVAERPDAAYQTLLATVTQAGIMGGANALGNRLNSQPEQAEPSATDYQELAARVFGQPATRPAPAAATPAAPTTPEAPQPAIAPEVVDNILSAIEQTQTPAQPAAQPIQQPAQELSDADVFGEAETVTQPATSVATEEGAGGSQPLQVAPLQESENVQVLPQEFEGTQDQAPALEATAIQTDQAAIEQPAIEPAAGLAGAPADGLANVEAAGVEIQSPLVLNRGQQLTEAQPGMRPGDIVGLNGKPYSNEALAKSVATEAGKGWRVKRSNGGFVVRYQPATEKQIATAKANARRSGNVDSTRDNMFAAIAKLGGINKAQIESEWGVDPADLKTAPGAGIKRVATSKGRSIDSMAEALADLGYLSKDDNGRYDIREFEELFGDELSGSKHYTAEGYMTRAQAEQEEALEDFLSDQDAQDSGYNDLPEEAQDLIDKALNDYEESTADEEARLEREAIQWANQLGPSVAADDSDIPFDAFPEETNDTGFGETVAQAPGEQTEGEDFGLTGQTPEDVRAQETQRQEDQRQQREAEQRAQADDEVGDFTLTGSDRAVDRAEAAGQTNIFDQPAEAEPAPVGKIEDFGEKLGGAKKDRPASIDVELTDKDIADQPLSKIWPAAEIDKIENKYAAAVAYAARAEVPSKPRNGYKLNRWVEKVKSAREIYKLINSGTFTEQEFGERLRDPNYSLRDFAAKVDLLNAIDRDQWKRVGEVAEYPDSYRYNGDVKVPTPAVRVEIDGANKYFRDVGTVAEALEQIQAALGQAAPTKAMQFEIRYNRDTGQAFINKKGDSEYRKLKTFPDVAAAREFMKTGQAELEQAWEQTKERENVKKTDVRGDANRPRTGADYRQGQDVTPELFTETFGFRGTEFGNWVSQGKNAKERQGMLNQAFDALMDLANIVGIPPKAISLNGTLGLAFGSRGSGNAAAHFEPGNLVINLTKTKGAGSLAHEWFHALDNYFARQRGGEVKMGRGFNAKDAYRTNNFITYRPQPMYVHKSQRTAPLSRNRLLDMRKANPKSPFFAPENWQLDPDHPNGVRIEVEQAFADLVDALDKSPMKARADSLDKTPDAYWGQIIERGARAFENYVIAKMMEQGYNNDYLANVRSVEDFPRSADRYPYLLADELAPVKKAFEALFTTIDVRPTSDGVMLFENQEQYDAQAPRRTYTDDRQLQLFLDNGPVETQAGQAGIDAQRAAVSAVDDLRSTDTILGLALSRDYAERQRTSLVGQKVSSNEDLAVLAQVYRDPRFETFRVVFVNDQGTVISHMGLTSRLPASTVAIAGDDAQFFAELKQTARNRGATGYYLLHNHPSGLATPSRADEFLTRRYAQNTDGALAFKGHVVIDTNEYAVIDRTGQWEVTKKDFGQPKPMTFGEFGGIKITGPDDVMAIAKNLAVDKDAVTLITLDSQLIVKGVTTVPAAAITKDKESNRRTVVRASMKQQGSQVIAVSGDMDTLKNMGSVVTDGIYVTSQGQVASLRNMGALNGGNLFPETRRARVSPDTSPEFAYLRDRLQPGQEQRQAAEPQPGQTNTAAFKRWFGDSKVVDSQGRPLVVYHGTRGDITDFSPEKGAELSPFSLGNKGLYFTKNPDYANAYARSRDGKRNTDGGNILPVYLSLQNPLVVDGEISFDERMSSAYVSAARIEELKAQGYDGIINESAQEIVVFDPTQVKSATGNQGTFDPNDESIVREEGPQYSVNGRQPSRNRDALGRVKFRLGEVAFGKLDAATRPIQERFGMRLASPQLRKQLRKMKATIDQANRKAANVAEQMKQIPEADRVLVSDIVEQMLAPGVVPPEHAVRIADSITKTMDTQTDELVELGMLNKEAAERWRGRYLPRIYNRQTELGEDTTMDMVKNLFRNGRPNMQGIGGGSLKGRGLFEEVSVDSVDQWLEMGYEVRDPNWKMFEGKLELVDENAPVTARETVIVWRDWTPSERAQMGENRDALFRFAQGYTNMQRDIALGRLFNEIASNPEFVRKSGSDGWVKVPDTEIPDTGGVKRYGKLAGLYVRQDVMSHLSRFEESANEALQIWREALGVWKAGKTALNPVAHFNNIASNVSMAHFAGVSYWDGHKYVGAVRDLVNDAPMVEEAREIGLFTGSFSREELMQNLPPELMKLMKQDDSALRKAGGKVMDALTFWLRKPLTDAYEFEDTFFKYLIYRDARNQGMSPEDATDYALRYIFTYDDLPSGARKVRDFAIPFFSWIYKATPALLHTAMVYPWRFAAPAAMLHGINLVAYALAAGDEDDNWLEMIAKGRELEKEERAALPDYRKGMSALGSPKNIRLGTDSVTGNPLFLDASRVIPGGDMFDMENQAGGLPIPAPLMPNHPVLSVFAAMIANKEMFMGREIVDRNDTGLEAAEKRAKWMAGFLLPAVAPGGYHSQRIADATANAMDTVIETPLGEFTGVDKSGMPVQPKYAAMQTFGIKVRPTDIELEQSRQNARDAAMVRSIAAEVRSMARLYQRGAVSEDMMERTREKAREKIERLRNEEE